MRLKGMQTFPVLRGTRLAPVDAVEFRARDGLILHAYLTTPMDTNRNALVVSTAVEFVV